MFNWAWHARNVLEMEVIGFKCRDYLYLSSWQILSAVIEYRVLLFIFLMEELKLHLHKNNECKQKETKLEKKKQEVKRIIWMMNQLQLEVAQLAGYQHQGPHLTQ